MKTPFLSSATLQYHWSSKVEEDTHGWGDWSEHDAGRSTSEEEAPESTKKNQDIVNWTPHVEATFIMHEEVKKGNMQTSTFKKKQRDEFKTKLFSLLGVWFSIKQLKGKFNRLREQHQLFSWMLKQTDVGWDPSTNNIDVSNDKWEEFTKVYSNWHWNLPILIYLFLWKFMGPRIGRLCWTTSSIRQLGISEYPTMWLFPFGCGKAQLWLYLSKQLWGTHYLEVWSNINKVWLLLCL